MGQNSQPTSDCEFSPLRLHCLPPLLPRKKHQKNCNRHTEPSPDNSPPARGRVGCWHPPPGQVCMPLEHYRDWSKAEEKFGWAEGIQCANRSATMPRVHEKVGYSMYSVDPSCQYTDSSYRICPASPVRYAIRLLARPLLLRGSVPILLARLLNNFPG